MKNNTLLFSRILFGWLIDAFYHDIILLWCGKIKRWMNWVKARFLTLDTTHIFIIPSPTFFFQGITFYYWCTGTVWKKKEATTLNIFYLLPNSYLLMVSLYKTRQHGFVARLFLFRIWVGCVGCNSHYNCVEQLIE